MHTIERWQQDPEFRKMESENYKELVLSELLLALMDEDEKSVRELAKAAGLSATAIQKVRSGKSKDMGLMNFLHVVEACGYHLMLEKNGKHIPLRAGNLSQ
ncbi:MAG: hypothetical protein SF052_23370 [Bacteroidia bacterium]|nr:hypothetical protein [Bacteroidia bacterium]